MTAAASVFHNLGVHTALAKIEATEGTDAVPAIGTDDIVVVSDGVQMAEGVEHGTVMPAMPYGGEVPAPMIARRGTWTIPLLLYGKGLTVGDITNHIPAWLGVILQTVGKVTIGSADPSSAVWAPRTVDPHLIDNADAKQAKGSTFTLARYVGRSNDWTQHKLQKQVACRVSQLVFNFSPATDVVICTASGVGVPVEPSDIAATSGGNDVLASATLDGTNNDWLVANAQSSQLIKQSSAGSGYCDLSAFSITVDFGAIHVITDGAEGGANATAHGQPTVTFTFDPSIQKDSDYDLVNDIWRPIQYDGTTHDELRIDTSEIFPAGRAANTGFGLSFSLRGVQYNGEINRAQDRLRIDGNGKCTRTSITAELMEMSLS